MNLYYSFLLKFYPPVGLSELTSMAQKSTLHSRDAAMWTVEVVTNGPMVNASTPPAKHFPSSC